MNDSLARRTGSALVWRATQLLAGRAISLGRFLLLSLLLAPDVFGLLAIAATALEVLLAFTAFGIEPALLQRAKREERQYDVGWTIRLVRSAVVALAAAIAAPVVAQIFGAPEATNLIRILALRPVIEALASIKTVDLARDLNFRALALITIPATVVEAVVSISLAQALEVWALVIGALLGAAAGSALSYLLAPYRPRIIFDRAPAAVLLRFGRWIWATSVIGVVGGAVLQAVVSRRLGTVQLGLYFLAMRLAFLPNEAVTDVVRDVVFPLHAGLQSHLERSARVFRSSLVAMLAVIAPVYAALIAVAPSLSEDVLGSGWEGTARVIQILAVVGIIGALADATMPMLEGHGRPELVTVLYAIRSVIVVALVWPLAGSYGVEGAAAAWLAAEIGVQAGCAIFANRVLPRPFRGLAIPIAVVAAAALCAGALAWGSNSVVGGPAGVFVGAVAGVLAGAIVLVWMDRRWEVGLAEDLGRVYPRLAPLLRLPGPAD